MGLNERKKARNLLERASEEFSSNASDAFLDFLLYAIREAEEAGLSYEEIVKLIISYLEHYANCTQDQ